jgi:hypothetical protein
MATTLDIEIYQGDTYRRGLSLTDSDGGPLDVTGYSFTSEIRRAEDSATELATFSVSILDAVNGSVEMRLEAADTLALPVPTTNWVWDFQSESGDATPVITTHYKGEVTMEKQVSR